LERHDFRVLIVDDEEGIHESLKAIVSIEGYASDIAANVAQAQALLRRYTYDLALVDIRLPDGSGIALLEPLKRMGTKTVMITAFATVDTAVEALKSGAADYLRKPFEIDEVRMLCADAFRDVSARRKGNVTPESPTLVYRSEAMGKLLDIIDKVAGHNIPVLILGESGVGKEVVARCIHDRGPRRESPFIGINMAAIPSELIESELFGHEKGSFTGAIERRMGRFELAERGTLFLDEIGDLSPALQAKLLRVLEERSFEPVGSVKQKQLKARVIAATNKDILESVRLGDFRTDLYYRLNGIRIDIPPLAHRREDVEPLVDHFLGRFASNFGKHGISVDPNAMARLERYPWPGNVRELKHAVERAVLLCEDGALLGPEDFVLGDSEGPNTSIRELEDNLERDSLITALIDNNFNRSAAAQSLKISRRTLYNRMKKHLLLKDGG
jgi:two-component system, NtrC family, response regulator AtoC